MASIHIRNVPPEAQNVLAARAARQGQSLQTYLLELVTTAAARPTVTEWLAQVERRQAQLPSSASPDRLSRLIAEPDEDER